MISYYLDRGHTIKELLGLSYYERLYYVASMELNHDEDLEEKITFNPHIKKKWGE